MLMPEGVLINGNSGALSVETGRYTKRLSELRGVFQDHEDVDRIVAAQNDPIIYEVIEYKKPGSDIFFGTTTMYPGNVGGEFYMTRGHFHARRDIGEVYYTQSGNGVLLLESREGQSEIVRMAPGVCAFIPPDWAHRSINTGDEPLVFVWMCNVEAGNDYADILQRGMRKIVVKRDGLETITDNPRW